VLHFQTGFARLLPKIIDGRTSGPLFLFRDRHGRGSGTGGSGPRSGHRPGSAVLPPSGRSLLRRSPGRTLHQLRHSAITHLAEEGMPLPVLMAKSRHASLRTLQRYARPSVDAVARLTAENDPARRR